jgi:hypothetical protein
MDSTKQFYGNDFISFFLGYIWDDLCTREQSLYKIACRQYFALDKKTGKEYEDLLNRILEYKSNLREYRISEALQKQYFMHLNNHLNNLVLAL